MRCNAEVARIAAHGRRAVGVRLTSGETIAADIVVSNANAAWTFASCCRRSAGAAGPTAASSARATR